MYPQYDSITGSTTLRIPAIQSPNFVAGTSGWIIRQDGSVEFNNGVFRGSITSGTDPGQHIVINNSVTGDAVDVYDSSNRLIFAILANGHVDSYRQPTTDYVELAAGFVLFGTSSNEPSSHAGLTSTSNAGQSLLNVLSGISAGGILQSSLQLRDSSAANGGVAYIQAVQRNITGSLVQNDQAGTKNVIHLFAAASSAVDLGGGFIGVKFSHGASFTPTIAIALPYDGPSVSNLFSFNLESISSTQVIFSVMHLDGTAVGVGENIECHCLVAE